MLDTMSNESSSEGSSREMSLLSRPFTASRSSRDGKGTSSRGSRSHNSASSISGISSEVKRSNNIYVNCYEKEV